jgi:hypothetical protein
MKGMKHLDGIGELGNVDRSVRLFVVRDPDLLHTRPDTGKPFSVTRLQPHLDSRQFLAEGIPRPFWEPMGSLSGVTQPADFLEL